MHCFLCIFWWYILLQFDVLGERNSNNIMLCYQIYIENLFINLWIHRAFPTSITIDIWLPSFAKRFCIVAYCEANYTLPLFCDYVTENFTKRYNKSIFHLIWHLFNYSFRFLRKKIGFYVVYRLDLFILNLSCLLYCV